MSAVIQTVAPWVLAPAFVAMQPYQQWFIYRLYDRDPTDGKYQKEPIHARTRRIPSKDHGGIEACTDWATVAQVGAELQAAARAGEFYVPGFYFTASDPFWFLDIDGCLIRNAQGNLDWSLLAYKLLGMFPDAAREISSSQCGLHVIGSGTAPAHGCKNVANKLEFYTEGRGIALTCTQATGDVTADYGAVVAGLVAEYFPLKAQTDTTAEWTTEPVPQWRGPEDDAELISLMLGARLKPEEIFGAKASFVDLWHANEIKLARAYRPQSNAWPWDRSGADLGLANWLAFYTGNDCERMARLMRTSGLADARANDNKWDARPDYFEGTILRACASQTKWYGSRAAAGEPATNVQIANPTMSPAALAASASDVVTGVSTAQPLVTATSFLGAQVFPELKCWKKEFFCYRDGIYVPVSVATVRAKLYPFIQAGGGTPTRDVVSNVVDALQAAAHLDDATHPPSWLDDPACKIPGLIICKNGAFDLDTGIRYPLTPNLFSFNALPLEYDPTAEAPEWRKFLDSVWRHDPQSIETLQEICGLLLTPLTIFQKMFLLCGPRRSGKGTILRVIRALLGGTDNVVAPTLGSLAGNFGLQPLIGKLAAFVGDVRLSDRADQATLVERLLSITGEDNISIPRKHTTDFDTKLNVRFVFSSNEIPALSDASGAAASRFIVLVMTESFYGREDLGLEARLMRELTGIMAWCVAGRRRLIQRGRFIQPESAREQIQQLDELSSPVAAFVRERCSVTPGQQISVDALFSAWANWCGHNGRKAGTSQMFGRNLRAALPRIKVTQPRTSGPRERYYEGIGVIEDGRVPFGLAPLPAALR